MRGLGVMLCGVFWGCGGASPAPPPKAPAKAPADPAPSASAARGEGVQVKGLEGTLQAYDVRDTMNRRLDALARCQQQGVQRVRVLSGDITLAIHVRTDGSVGQVDVLESTLGHLPAEQCIVEVTRETRFPAPHGGEADVKWDMTLEPLAGRSAAEYEQERLAETLELGLPDLAEHCEMRRRSPSLTVTAYVAPSGKVITAGADTQAKGQHALLACVAEQVASWRLPRAGKVAKVSFEARYRRPLDDAQRKAIRKKHARRRKAEKRRKQAEARRKRRRRRAHKRRGGNG